MRGLLAWGALALLAVPRPTTAQRNIDRQIRENRGRLDEIRQARDGLQDELEDIRGRARSLTTELRNIDQQRTATSRLVNELDRQLSTLINQVDTISFELVLAEDAIAEKRAVLERRLSEIYKRGSLWAFEVLLAAESFGDLLSRYKYLYLVSRQDRHLTDEVEHLRNQIAGQREDLLNVQTELSSQRRLRDSELREYAQLEQQRQRALSQMRASERRTADRLDSLSRDEKNLNAAIAALERARRAAARRGETAVAYLTPADLGHLEWPVQGDVIYHFGREGFRDNTAIRYQGIGIRVPVGTPVRAVQTGRVVFAGPYGTYGLTTWIDHGAGYYTLYLNLSRIDVRQGQLVSQGDVLGESGGEGSDEGPHLQFQIRQTPENAETPLPLDPLNWLKPQ